MRLIWDIETNAKNIDRVSHVWCIACKNVETGEEFSFNPERIEEGVSRLADAETLIGHNVLLFDIPVLEKLYNFKPRGRIIDTLMLSRLIFNGLSDKPDRYGRHDLRAWGRRLGCHKGEWSDFSQFSPGMMEYCVQDVRTTAKLLDHLRAARPSAAAVNLEIEVSDLMRQVSRQGFPVDVPGIERLKARLESRLVKLQQRLDKMFPPEVTETDQPEWYGFRYKGEWQPLIADIAVEEVPNFATKTEREVWRKEQGIRKCEIEYLEGPRIVKTKRFNANSSQQVVASLEDLGWRPTKFNESGSVNASELELCNSGIPAARVIAAYRGYTKLLGFANQWLEATQEGRIHSQFISLRASTGRSACRDPNLQQIPSTVKKRLSGLRSLDRYGKKCREVFTASPGHVLVGSDLAGIEIRLLGHYLSPFDGGRFAERVTSGVDIHQANADDTGIDRYSAKTLLYSILYGAGPSKIAEQLKVRPDQGQQTIHRFTAGFNGLKQLQASLLRELRKTGRVTLIDGRRIQVSSDHKVLNFIIQGSAAVLMKRWMLDAAEVLKSTSFRILAVVHDECQSQCTEADKDCVMEALPRLATEAGRKLGFKVPIAAEVKCGRSWAETH